MTIGKLCAGASCLALALNANAALAASSKPVDRYELGYFLSKTVAAASFSQRLVRCPTSDDDNVYIESRAQIAAKVVPDYVRLYRVDARAGFLAKRSTELKLAPDGTLKSINATTEGQGGAVIGSVLKAAAFVAPLAIGMPPLGGKAPNLVGAPPPPKPSIRCSKAVLAKLAERETQAEGIADMESKLASDGLSAAQTELLTLRRSKLAEIDDGLTLSSDPVRVDLARPDPIRVPALDYARWFEGFGPRDLPTLERLGGVGLYGLTLTWKANDLAKTALSGDGGAEPTGAESALYYRRPVPVTVTLTPCKSSAAACEADERPAAEPLASSSVVGFLQLSGLFRLPIGHGGLFGSKEVAAEFDETGAPVSLKYGSDPGAADIASTIDAARDAGTTLRDAKSDALTREAAMLKSRKDIKDLLAELDKPAS